MMQGDIAMRPSSYFRDLTLERVVDPRLDPREVDRWLVSGQDDISGRQEAIAYYVDACLKNSRGRMSARRVFG